MQSFLVGVEHGCSCEYVCAAIRGVTATGIDIPRVSVGLASLNKTEAHTARAV